MAANIRSEVPAKPTVDGASRDDLSTGDVVTLTSIDAAATYTWTLVFIPEGSAAVIAGSGVSVSFTADLVGPYLVRLVVDIGLATEDVQYVRLRALTTSLGLKLVAAGERRDSTGVIPVDVDTGGWANEQNYNLQALETALAGIGGVWSISATAGPTYTASNTEFVVITANTVEITLPAPVLNHRVAFKLAVVPVDVQVKTSGAGVTIDGTDYSGVGLPLTAQWDQFNVISDGSNWFIW